MTDSKCRATLRISAELLRRVLGIPDSVDIVAGEFDPKMDLLCLTVRHPALPEVETGMEPLVCLVHSDRVGEVRWGKIVLVKGAISIDGAEVALIEAAIAWKDK